MAAVILDTDIGSNIDDTWAVAMLVNCPELDVRLIATGTGDPTYRAGIVAGLLTVAGRDDVPIGLGLPTRIPSGPVRPQGGFAREVGLGRYRGPVADDGVRAIVDCVAESAEPVTIVTLGPLTNVAAALERDPDIVRNARVVGMLGSVHDPVPESNVVRDVEACRAVLGAGWDVTIAPLDTCGLVTLKGARYAAVRDAGTPLMRAVLRTYREWVDTMSPYVPDWFEALDAGTDADRRAIPVHERRSTVLFDTVAVQLAYDESLVELESLPIAIDDAGVMRVTPGAPQLRAATSWRDLDAFTDHLVERLVTRQRDAAVQGEAHEQSHHRDPADGPGQPA